MSLEKEKHDAPRSDMHPVNVGSQGGRNSRTACEWRRAYIAHIAIYSTKRHWDFAGVGAGDDAGGCGARGRGRDRGRRTFGRRSRTGLSPGRRAKGKLGEDAS